MRGHQPMDEKMNERAVFGSMLVTTRVLKGFLAVDMRQYRRFDRESTCAGYQVPLLCRERGGGRRDVAPAGRRQAHVSVRFAMVLRRGVGCSGVQWGAVGCSGLQWGAVTTAAGAAWVRFACY